MDLVDLARIVLRRWYVAAAILVLGAIASIVLVGTIQPQYRVEAQSILISGQPDASAPGVEGPGNPYLSFSGSLYTTLSAVTRTVDGQEYRDLLDADGAERDFLFTTSQEAPVIITESTAGSPDEALELSTSVQDALSETLENLQSAENVPQDQQIGIRVLTTSEPVAEMGDRNRVLVGVLGVTLAAAIGGAVLVESIVQTRRRSRASREAEDPTAPPLVVGEDGDDARGESPDEGAGTEDRDGSDVGDDVPSEDAPGPEEGGPEEDAVPSGPDPARA